MFPSLGVTSSLTLIKLTSGLTDEVEPAAGSTDMPSGIMPKSPPTVSSGSDKASREGEPSLDLLAVARGGGITRNGCTKWPGFTMF